MLDISTSCKQNIAFKLYKILHNKYDVQCIISKCTIIPRIEPPGVYSILKPLGRGLFEGRIIKFRPEGEKVFEDFTNISVFMDF